VRSYNPDSNSLTANNEQEPKFTDTVKMHKMQKFMLNGKRLYFSKVVELVKKPLPSKRLFKHL